MTIAEKLAKLQDLVGSAIQLYYTTNFFIFWTTLKEGWWLWINDENEQYYVVWMVSGRDVHNRGKGRGICVHIRKDNGERDDRGFGDWTGAFETAISVIPVREEVRASEIYGEIVEAINFAYRHYVEEGQ